MFDIIIVGAGPAGLTAAIYAKRASKKVLVIEAKNYGGQIINASSIENYPVEKSISGVDFAEKLYNQVKDLGVEVLFEKVIDLNINDSYKEVITNKNKYKTKAIILATGSDNRKLGLENEDELLGKGVSYCATCDGNFYKGKQVAVVGGGNTALEDALYLSDISSKVYLIHRGTSFRADSINVKKIEEKNNIEIILNSEITKLIGSNKLNSLVVTNTEGNERIIEVDGLFIAVGRIPENQNFAKYIKLDELGYAIAGEDCKTNTDGIYVSGDNRKKELRQLVTATSDGAVAAFQAIKYINNSNN